jgi:predicted RNase H-like nuclease (RuvC/YqgF family)
MTDKEIIKALECCKGGFCCACPRLSNGRLTGACMRELINDALDLINRQQAEIELLQIELKGKVENWSKSTNFAMEVIKRQDAEIEKLEKEISTTTNHITRLENQIERLLPMLKTKRADVIKELEAKIHEKLHEAEIHGNFEPVVTREMFDSVTKEMVGEQE